MKWTGEFDLYTLLADTEILNPEKVADSKKSRYVSGGALITQISSEKMFC